jgi:cellulose synthase/poly-beta-1,6-N-acetylglucosamine synthase-like glycosyltransferase
LYAASVAPNANKVGALFLASLSITHAYVILTDFDTDMLNLGRVSRLTDILEQDDDLMGCYFRMLPHGGKGVVFEFQQMEYSLLRCQYTFHKKEKSVTVMPGAGSLFKREVLNSIYSQHSGFRSGEDREATQIGHKLGYTALYVDDILALTRPPLAFKALIRQRIRWNLGYLETILKEKGYYLKQVLKCTRIGLRVWVDLLILFFLVFLPLLVILPDAIGFQRLLLLLSGIYLFCLGWNAYLLLRAPGETFEMGGKRIILLLCYPVMKLVVDYCSWMGAILKLLKK